MWQRKSDGRWCERVPIDGNVKTVTAKTKTALNKKLSNYRTYQAKSKTFKEYAELWEDAHSRQVEFNTYQSYIPHVRRAIDHFADEKMEDITPDEIQAYVEYLASLQYKKATVQRGLHVVNMIFKFAIVQKGSEVRYNPCAAVSVPKGLKQVRREPPTEEQLVKVTPDSEFGLFAYFLLLTGLRRGELLALRWEDIDRENKTISINKSVAYIGNAPHLKDTKTEAGTRTVILPDLLLQALPKKKKGYVFGGDKPLTAGRFTRGWLDWCKSVGLAERIEETHTAANKHTYTKVIYKPLVTPHQFRHEYATILEGAGVSEFDAKTLLGHSSIVVTKDIYTHIRNSKSHSETADKLNNYVAKEFAK